MTSKVQACCISGVPWYWAHSEFCHRGLRVEKVSTPVIIDRLGWLRHGLPAPPRAPRASDFTSASSPPVRSGPFHFSAQQCSQRQTAAGRSAKDADIFGLCCLEHFTVDDKGRRGRKHRCRAWGQLGCPRRDRNSLRGRRPGCACDGRR
jgi:hypothetical protein